MRVSCAFSAVNHENHHEIVLSRNVFEKFGNFQIYFGISSYYTLHNKFEFFSASEEILVIFYRFLHAKFSGVVRILPSRKVLKKNDVKDFALCNLRGS